MSKGVYIEILYSGASRTIYYHPVKQDKRVSIYGNARKDPLGYFIEFERMKGGFWIFPR